MHFTKKYQLIRDIPLDLLGLKMTQKTRVTVVVFSVLSVCAGAVDLFCNKVDPMQPSTLTCTCRYTNGVGVLWYKNGDFMSDCFLQADFCLRYPGVSFSLNSSTNEFSFTLDSYNYPNCDVYTCRDSKKPNVNDTKRIAGNDSTSISALNIIEPTTNHTSGFIGVTTECIYGASSEVTDLDIQWLVVMEGVEKSFNPLNTTIKPLNGSCQVCVGDMAAQFLIGFYHKEEMGCQGKEAKVRIILRHNGISSEPLNITTRNFYCVSDQTSDGTSSRRSTISYILIFFIIFVFPQYSVLAFIYIDRKRNTKPPGGEGNRDASTEMKDFIPKENTKGKMKSWSTTLKRFQDKFLLLAFVPVLGIIGIIAYIYTRCSGTDTEGKSAKGARRVIVESIEMCLTGSERQPDNLNNGSNSDCSLLSEGDCTKHNDNDYGYITNGTSTHSTL